MKKTAATLFLALAATTATAAEPLRVGVPTGPGLDPGVIPVALAAGDASKVKLISIERDTAAQAVTTNKVDCAVMSMPDAIRAFTTSNGDVRIATGLAYDKGAPRATRSSVLACSQSAVEKGREETVAFGSVLGAALGELFLARPVGEDRDKLVEVVVKRAGLPASAGEDVLRVLEEPANSRTGVVFSYVPRDVLWSAGSVGAEGVERAEQVMHEGVRLTMRDEGKSAR